MRLKNFIVVASLLCVTLVLGGQAKFAPFMAVGPRTPAARSPLMVDLDIVSSNGYTNDQPFLNYYKSANRWGGTGLFLRSSSCSYSQPGGSEPPYDSDGYPTKLSPTGSAYDAVKSTVFQGSLVVKTGTYHVYYDGTPGAGGHLELCNGGSLVSGFTDDGVGTITFTLASAAAIAGPAMGS